VKRRCLLALALVTACGGRAPDVKPAGTAPPPTAGTPAPHPAQGGGTLPDVACAAPTCAFHAGAAGYFTCLAGGAGACFHFGGPCTPADACMYDPTDRTYKKCGRAVEGTCAQWTGACAPASACMFDAADGLHHHCDAVSGGACQKYGALCAP
jgi:hypothetical protein